RALPQTFIWQVEPEGIEDDLFVIGGRFHRTLPKPYGTVMTSDSNLGHCAPMMDGWQYKSAFVIQFRSDADIEAGFFEGRIEHVASCRAVKFHTLEALLTFMSTVLAEVRKEDESEQQR